jgi:hypothetical protein
MSVGDAAGVETPTEFKSALEKLQRIFGGVLFDAKLNSCSAAWTEIKGTKNTKKRIEIFNEKAQQWREDSVKAIKEWLPKFVDLAQAYPEAIDGDALCWTKDKIWERVEAQCEISRPGDGEPLRRDRITRTMMHWFAVASEGNFQVNLHPLRPWKAPRWLARGGTEKDALLRLHADSLWLRLSHVIDERLDLVQIQKAIDSGDAVARKTQARSRADLETVTDTNTWASFHARFESLSKEEASVSLSNKQDQRINASSVGEMKEWNLGGGINESFHASVEMLATHAGAKLGTTPRGSTKLNHWLCRLYLELEKNHSKLLFAPVGGTPKAAMITSVCQASANFCARLEQQTVENSEVAGHGVIEQEESIFRPSADYRSIKYKGVPYSLTRNQSTIVRLLHDAYLNGTPALGGDALLSAIEAETSRVRDSFKGSLLWGNLIVSNRSPRGTYRLNLE